MLNLLTILWFITGYMKIIFPKKMIINILMNIMIGFILKKKEKINYFKKK